VIARVILALVAVVVVAGWPTAIFYFTKWRDVDVSLAVSEAERVKSEQSFKLIQRDMEKQIESVGRLDEIRHRLGSAKDQVTALERQIQSKQGALREIGDKIEFGEAELARLDSQLSARKASVNEIEKEPKLENAASERLRTENEDVKRKAVLAASEPTPETTQEPGITSEFAAVQSEPRESVTPQPKETDSIVDAKRRFEIVDKNGDGRIDQFEFDVKSVLIHYRLDTNQDDFLSIDETLLSDESFKLLDSDADKKISPQEFIKAFPIFDTAGQGFITFDDYLAFIHTTADCQECPD
jgi:Ca2+-binding EF-hand superfamily protein